MPPRPPDLPDAVVGLVPHPIEVIHDRGHHLVGLAVDGGGIHHILPDATRHAGPGRVHHLTEHVELELLAGLVADPNRARSLVAGEPVELDLGETALTADSVHDLEVAGRAGHGSTQPVVPRDRLLGVAGHEEGLQGEGRIAQPRVAVVPVAHAADPFGQRRRGGGGHRTRGGIGERLERDERAHDVVAPVTGVGAARHPGLPPRLGAAQRRQRVEGQRRIVEGGEPGQREAEAIALAHAELGDGRQVAALDQHGTVELQRVLTRDQREAVAGLGHPRHDRSVVEAHDQVHVHLDDPAAALDHTEDRGVLGSHGHEVDDGDGPRRRHVLGLEHERVLAIATGGRRLARRCDEPASVLGFAEQGGEGRARVDPRSAPPVDRATSLDQRHRVGVPDDRVVLDAASHGLSCGSTDRTRRVHHTEGGGARSA